MFGDIKKDNDMTLFRVKNSRLSLHNSIFLGCYLLCIVFCFITVFKDLSLSQITANNIITINLIQRISGLILYIVLAFQIVLGAHMNIWIQVLGSKAYRYHIMFGLSALVFIIIHPLMQLSIDFLVLGPSSIFLSLLPGRNIFLNLGKLALFILLFSITAAYFRTSRFFRKIWLKVHILNYVAFILVALHAWRLGADVIRPPFVYLYFLFLTSVLSTILYKVFKWSLNEFRNFAIEGKE